MRSKLIVVLAAGALIFLTSQSAAGEDDPGGDKFLRGAKCLVAEHETAAKGDTSKANSLSTGGTKGADAAVADPAKSDAITKEQADAIVSELKQIRQLLEKQQAQLAAAIAPRPTPAPAPPEKVQMSVANGWYSLGRADAPVMLVEFADFQCPFCKKFHTDAYAELKKNYIDTGKVRFVSRDLPLDFHPFALKAAEAARCAGDQQKYWELRDALYSNAAPPNDEVIGKAIETLSLDKVAFQSCLSSEKYKADVQKDAGEAAKLQISGTPTFVLAKSAKDKLDGVRIVGAQPFAAFQSAINALLKNPSAAAAAVPNGKGD
jgi:protein-disulfide isomerase